MFVIIGTKIKKEDLGCLPEMRLCPRCRRVVYNRIIREQRWFAVFWVPLFPIHTEEYLQCPCCGLTFPIKQGSEVPTDQITNAAATSIPQNGTLPDQSAGAAATSMLQKGARQAGRLYGKFLKSLE